MSLSLNSIGAIATCAALIILLATKFIEGAWVTVLLIPVLLGLMKLIYQHYRYVRIKTSSSHCINLCHIAPPIAILPIDRWNKLTENGLQFALQLTEDIVAVHVVVDEERLNFITDSWDKYVTIPFRKAGKKIPKLTILPSPYRLYEKPLFEYVLQLEKDNPGKTIAFIVPELVQSRWYQYFLHNQRAHSLKNMLLRQGDRRIVMINVPWYLN